MPPKRAKTNAKSDTSRGATRTTRATRNTKEAVASDEDVTNGLVRSSTRRTGARNTHKDVDVRVSGGLGKRSEKSSPVANAEADKSEFDVPVESEEEAQAVTPVKKNVRKRPVRTVKKAQTDAQRLAIEGLKKRMEADKRANAEGVSPHERKRQSVARAPEAEKQNQNIAQAVRKSSSSPAQAVPGTARKPPQSALKVQSTPGVESSVLALANFRRRPRQPSLLQMVQQGELGQDTPGQDTTDFTLGSDQDDFAPYDESTPLQTVKVQQAAVTAPPAAQEEDDDELYRLSPQPPNPRKRKSDEMEREPEIEVIRSSPSRLTSPIPSEADLPGEPSTIPGTAPDEDEESSEPRRQQIHSDTFADPMSSSPPPVPSQSPHKVTEAAAKHARPPRRQATSPLQARVSQQKALNTAALRALLPRRRIKQRRSDYDVPSSSDMGQASSDIDEDADELAHRNRSRRLMKSSKVPAAKTKSARKGHLSPITTKKPAAAKTKRTYGRASGISDKENDSSSSLSELTSNQSTEEREGTGDTSVETVAPKKNKRPISELQAAKAKFAEIDRWEMEFDSAPSLGAAGGDSSPWR